MNFETVKLWATSAQLDNLILLAVILLAAIVTATRSGGGHALLDRDHTDQARGLAILLVVLGHLWVHAVDPDPWFIASGEGVAVFLLLSGFGLTTSFKRTAPRPLAFIKKRVRRVMLPYWAATVLFLVLDFLLLHRTYSWSEVALTALGLNLTPATQLIDYVRWYITFLLFWYLCFAGLMYRLPAGRALGLLFACGAGALAFNYYVHDLGWYQFFAFPAGCWLALHTESARRLFNRAPARAGLGALALLGLCLAVKWAAHAEYFDMLPSLGKLLILEANAIAFSAALLGLLGWAGSRGWSSRALLFCGAVSYEMYLLHGPFIIKYNWLLRAAARPDNTWWLPLMFTLLVGGLLALSWMMKKALDRAG